MVGISILGEHWIIDDVTGLKVRASETRKMWNGAVVDAKQWEPRHPQDFVRSRPERVRVKEARPRPIAVYQGPLDTKLTAAAVPGATSLQVESSARMLAGDFLNIMLDNGDVFRVLLQSVPDATHLTLQEGLPGSVSIGNMIYDNSAIAPPVLP